MTVDVKLAAIRAHRMQVQLGQLAMFVYERSSS